MSVGSDEEEELPVPLVNLPVKKSVILPHPGEVLVKPTHTIGQPGYVV